MKKLKLDVETVAVQSFPTEQIDAPAPGTVRGQEAFAPSYIDFTACHTYCSCPDTR
ncbi:MAG TPA: hypothetical protein VF665_16620 [Longimicrobium sp.]|jgi:hypothetical protein|uniref:hypothetical protein n=1 Tax=Longimicrobium sp. TaxID=2029185 RepID=UPI002ED83938